MKIVADDKIPFLRGALEPYAEVLYLPGKDISRCVLKDADALITRTRTKCDRSTLEGTKVKFIGTATIGYDHIDTKYCESNGIKWTNAPGCNSSSVCQYVSSALLFLANARQTSIKEMTLGVVGVGNVGSKVAHFASSIGMKVLLNDPPRQRREGDERFVDMSTILKESDVITIHVPLTKSGIDATYHLFDEDIIGSMKSTACLINSSRGEVVDNIALKGALKNNVISDAVLDVWENEPNIDIDLMNATILSTPHIAGYSADGKANGTSMVVRSLSEFFDLPLTKWFPSDIPSPMQNEFCIDGKGKDNQTILWEAIRHTYDISIDSDALRTDPSKFELLRGSYWIRREIPAFSIKVKHCNKNVKSLLKSIGFTIS